MNGCEMKVIARIHTDLPEKFGLPRQGCLIPELRGKIVFEPEYRNADAVRGVEDFSHLWLIWQFSKAVRDTWSPLVRPPRLGGNEKMGVFATRSPFRPNAIGLSCVRLERMETTSDKGIVLHVSGADLMDGTPIYDIKPYLPYVDSIPDAKGGFASDHEDDHVEVVFPDEWLRAVPDELQSGLIGVLRQDPRPAYQNDPDRVYGFSYEGLEIRFTVRDGILTVCGIEKA